MIIIGGSPVSESAVVNEYRADSLERHIFNKMYSSNENYRYESMDELRFELQLRKEIVKASRDLLRSGMRFEVFRESECNPVYWDRSNEGGFVLKNGVLASAAINDIFLNGPKYGTECATAMVIVYYKALLQVYPTNLYDNLFKRIYLMNWHYMDKNLREIGSMRKPKEYLPGDRRYVVNPEVNPLTPEWRGENLIDLSDGMYYGHGMGIHTVDVVIRELNKNRREGAEKSAYLLDTVGLPNFKNLYNISKS